MTVSQRRAACPQVTTKTVNITILIININNIIIIAAATIIFIGIR